MDSTDTTNILFVLFFILFFGGPTMIDSVDTIETSFQFLPHLPKFSPGEDFAKETIDLGGILVTPIKTYKKIWATTDGVPDNNGATFYEPIGIPMGFSCLGYFGQPNDIPFYGHVLVGKDVSNYTSKPTLVSPVDYRITWKSESLNLTKEGEGYIWLPVAPDGYKAIGYVVTTSYNKPSLDKVKCIDEKFIQISKKVNDINGLKFYHSMHGFIVGDELLELADTTTINMPNMAQINELIALYAPVFSFNPEEKYLPSSVDWYFSNGALLVKQGDESNPIHIEKGGANLPRGHTMDTYWMTLPSNESQASYLIEGELSSALPYIHCKPASGGLFTDIAIWLFYPYNGEVSVNIGEGPFPWFTSGIHIGDWEHVTIRLRNVDGHLDSIYFAEHGYGQRVGASSIQKDYRGNPVVYVSKNGHAAYATPGDHMRVTRPINYDAGLVDQTSWSDKRLDTTNLYVILDVEYLGYVAYSEQWLDYLGKWGPHDDSPVGPKARSNWNSDE